MCVAWVRATSRLDLAMQVAVSSLSPVSIHVRIPAFLKYNMYNKKNQIG
jgi:hypothetical protein